MTTWQVNRLTFFLVGRRAQVAIVLAFCCLGTSVGRGQAPSPTPELRTTDEALVAASFQGQPLLMLLDSGTTRSFISVPVARAAGGVLNATFPLYGFGPGSGDGGHLTRPVTVQIPFEGGAMDWPVQSVADYRRLSALMGRDISGILGADFFEKFVVEMDYAAERIRLHSHKFKPPEEATTLSMGMTRGRAPLVDMRLHLPNGKTVKVRAMLDTGAGGLIAMEGTTRKHKLVDVLSGVEWPLGEGVGGKITGHVGRLPVLELGPFRLLDTVIALPSNGARDALVPQFELNVGSNVLKRFTVFFDYRRRKVTFVPNQRLGDPFDGTRTGLQLATLGSPHNRVIVEGVAPRSPASDAGFLAGDEVVEVNGEPLGSLALVDYRRKFEQLKDAEMKITVLRANTRVVLTLVPRRVVVH